METKFLFCHGQSDAIALIDAANGTTLTYDALEKATKVWAAKLAGPKGLVFHVSENTIDSVMSLLGSLRAGHAVALISPTMAPMQRQALDELYRPDFIISSAQPSAPDDYDASPTLPSLHTRKARVGDTIHPDLSIMLSTSGSTGSPKFVRLSAQALQFNGVAIAQALHIEADDVGYGHLQLHYSYGLSVLTSHLGAGARVVLTQSGLMQPAFWADAKAYNISHFPGVPFHYEMMLRLGFARLKLPAIKSMTQAGGRLALELQSKVHDWQSQNGGKFYVMYGQTEAAPRISTLQHEDLPTKIGSVGPALQGGRIAVCAPDGREVPAGQSGDIVYIGPNVMMGYALVRSDLAKGDENQQRLETGDIGYLDDAGCLFITGRASRFAKIAGVRIGLDEIEQAIGAGAAASGNDQKLVIWRTPACRLDSEAILEMLTESFGLSRAMCKVNETTDLPVRDNGKIDYTALKEMSQ